MPTPKTTITRTMHPTAMPITGPELGEDFTLLPGNRGCLQFKKKKNIKRLQKNSNEIIHLDTYRVWIRNSMVQILKGAYISDGLKYFP